MLTRYKSNKSIRKRIDKLLEENAHIWANLGTETPLDVGTRKKGEHKWRLIAKKIKALDEIFFNQICPYGIDS